jgi:hypothetical protein
MDAELLVDDQIAQGKSLIEQLIKDNFNVSVAFWVKATDDGSWQLHIVGSSPRRYHFCRQRGAALLSVVCS